MICLPKRGSEKFGPDPVAADWLLISILKQGENIIWIKLERYIKRPGKELPHVDLHRLGDSKLPKKKYLLILNLTQIMN